MTIVSEKEIVEDDPQSLISIKGNEDSIKMTSSSNHNNSAGGDSGAAASDVKTIDTAQDEAELGETLAPFKSIQTPMCVSNIYPSRVLWCNKAWLSLWDASDIEELRCRDRDAMHEWDGDAHESMKNLKEQIQDRGETESRNFTIFPNRVRKQVNLRQQPFKYKDRTYALSEHAAEIGTLGDTALRSVQGFNGAAVLISLFTPSGMIIHQNPASLGFHGDLKRLHKCDEGENKDVMLSLFPDVHSYHRMIDEMTETDGTNLSIRNSFKKRLRMKSGITQEYQWHEVHIVHGMDPVTGSPMYIMNENDVTMLKLLEDEVIKMKEEAFCSENAKKDQFLANCSHELRTPLNGIIGLSDGLLDDDSADLQPAALSNIKMINNCGRRLLGLVNDILDASKFAGRKANLFMEEVNFYKLVTERVALLKHAVDKHGNPQLHSGVEIVIDVPEKFPPVSCDPHRIEQVLNNLIGNAMKFTTKGSITISSKVVNDVIEVAVTDTGSGIKPDSLDRVFEVFEQDLKGGELVGGTGLGLPIAKSLIEAHGGQLWAESKVGEGSSFKFTLMPREKSSYKEDSKGAESVVKKKKKYDDLYSPTISSKKSATEVTENLELSEKKLNPPLEKDSKKDSMGAIYVEVEDDSSDSSDSDEEPETSIVSSSPKADKVGAMTGFLKRKSSQTINRNPSMVSMNSLSTLSSENLMPGRPKVILSVDDDPVNQMVLEQLLKKDKYEVLSALNGRAAVDLLKKLTRLPDLVLLDCMMPGMSGYETCDLIRSEFPTSNLPIIMVSAKSGAENVDKGLSHGCNDYIVKPFNKQELLSRIKTQLRLSDTFQVELENELNSALINSMLPEHISLRLKSGEKLIADSYPMVTILFSDIVKFTNLASEIGTDDLVILLNDMFSSFDQLTDDLGVFKVETIGDAYMVACGHEVGQEDQCDRMITLAKRMLEATEQFRTKGGKKVAIRIGIHSGPVVAGVVGTKNYRYCFFGDTVNVASRMESTGVPSQIHLSSATKELYDATHHSGKKIKFWSRGLVQVKGKGEMETYIAYTGSKSEVQRRLQEWDATIPIAEKYVSNNAKKIREDKEHQRELERLRNEYEGVKRKLKEVERVQAFESASSKESGNAPATAAALEEENSELQTEIDRLTEVARAAGDKFVAAQEAYITKQSELERKIVEIQTEKREVMRDLKQLKLEMGSSLVKSEAANNNAAIISLPPSSSRDTRTSASIGGGSNLSSLQEKIEKYEKDLKIKTRVIGALEARCKELALIGVESMTLF